MSKHEIEVDKIDSIEAEKTAAFEDAAELPPITDEGGNLYTLRITMKKIESIERMTGSGIFQMVQQTGGMLPVWVSRLFFQNCLYSSESKAVSGKKADDIMNGFMRAHSYPIVSAHVLQALDHDVPFLFRED